MPILRLPGILDTHVHLRDPGATHKEDVFSGTVAAASGGVIGVLDMPNNQPPITDRHTLLRKQSCFQDKAVVDYGLFLGYTGGSLDALCELSAQVVGLKLYLDATYGQMMMSDPALLGAVFNAWPGPGPIAVHAEGRSIDLAMELAARYDQRLHICHVPHPDDLLRIDAARQGGIRVTCEVTPHHLFLSDEASQRLGAYAVMRPPLVSARDVAAFWERLSLVDTVGSDHAPHTHQEKRSPSPPPGVPGVETTLSLFLWAVEQGRLTLERFVELTFHNPLRIFGLISPAQSYVEVFVDEPYRLPADGYRTRCGWSPFVGQWAIGRVSRVQIRNQIVWQEGELQVKAGFGRPLLRAGGE